ncbi:cupin domain-containing protein [Adhaeribacter radiodurans]|uniref:Cupin domain-containing protein n=1 Tax=Adhaeribacter radiodurans TaxID=2745197 RepID=A0A7L7LEK4_9BACT|nr:cupin domain-containing protein [Adhaeribacter radiodurans]QMU31286.1 cupin domain-containing protein [Adhaeribacter radiodurans]
MIKNLANAEHYSWGNNCEGWHLVKTPQLSIIQERMPAGAAEKIHYHRVAQQFFYIISGTATFLVNGAMYTVQAQNGLHILPGQHHQILNHTTNDLLFTVTSQPTSHGDRLELE